MPERFAYTTGTITIASGASAVTGIGTAWGGRDWAGAQIWVQPAAAAPYRVGTVAEVDPRGIYEDLELPLVSAWNGTTVTSQPYELIDGPAIANGTTQAAIYARFAAHIEQNMGLVGNLADEIDFALVPNNTLFVDAVTSTLYQWRDGVLNLVRVIGDQWAPRGPWEGAPTTKTALSISTGDVAIDFDTGAVDADGRMHFTLALSDTCELQLPTNVEVDDVFDILFVGDDSVPSFAAGFSGTAASAIRTTSGAKTRLRFTVTAETAGTATAVTAALVSFDENDLVEYGGHVFVSNADTNSAEPDDTPDSDANWTHIPVATVAQVLDALGVHSITISESDPSGGVAGDIWFKVGA